MRLKYLIVILGCLGLCSCAKTDDTTLYFVGDSIIARWDVSESFPAYICYNNGKSGAGMEYIQALAGQYEGKEVVVMIGTNDVNRFDLASRENYAKEYVRAITSLGGNHVYLYSVLPRDFKGDAEGLNDEIAAFNGIVKSEVASLSNITYMDVYYDFITNNKVNPQFYNDGLHLSRYGYEILVAKLDYYLNKN